MATNYETEQQQATLIDLVLPDKTTHRFQNWQQEPYYYNGNEYRWLNFEGGLGNTRGQGLGSSGRSVRLGNVDASSDSLNPVRNWMEQYGGLRRSRITVRVIWPNDISAPPMEERHEVLSSTIEGAEIVLLLKDPAHASNVQIPSLLLTRNIAPELPNASPGRI